MPVDFYAQKFATQREGLFPFQGIRAGFHVPYKLQKIEVIRAP